MWKAIREEAVKGIVAVAVPALIAAAGGIFGWTAKAVVDSKTVFVGEMPPSILLICKEPPRVPLEMTLDKAFVSYVHEVAEAGADCRRKLSATRDFLMGRTDNE